MQTPDFKVTITNLSLSPLLSGRPSKSVLADFPGSPVVKTPCLPMQRASKSDQGTKIPHATWCGKKKKAFFFML